MSLCSPQIDNLGTKNANLPRFQFGTKLIRALKTPTN